MFAAFGALSVTSQIMPWLFNEVVCIVNKSNNLVFWVTYFVICTIICHIDRDIKSSQGKYSELIKY
jgi:hypothetical protein